MRNPGYVVSNPALIFARSAFDDSRGFDGEDLGHSVSEVRRLRLARASSGEILLIAYTKRRKRHEEITRIISARRASRKERTRYEAPEED